MYQDRQRPPLYQDRQPPARPSAEAAQQDEGPLSAVDFMKMMAGQRAPGPAAGYVLSPRRDTLAAPFAVLNLRIKGA